ncbi:MAG: GntR family transcriptional regulator [Bacillota bacterium]
MFLDRPGVPLYLQLYELLKQKIISGEWAENALVPPESALMKAHGLSRDTVRRAVLRLVTEGYLYRQRGRGTFVCRRRPEDGLEQLISFTAEMLARGYRPGTIVLANDRQVPDSEVRQILQVSPGASVIHIKRLRTANDLPVAVEESFLRPDVFGEVDPAKLEGSFYQYLAYDKGIKPGRIAQEISSVLAGADTARLLEVNPGHPVLQLTRLIYTTTGIPFFWMVFRYRGDIYSIKTKLEL